MLHRILKFIITTTTAVAALDNGVGLLPPMGYNSWNDLGAKNINEANLKQRLLSMKNNGLQVGWVPSINGESFKRNVLNMDCEHGSYRMALRYTHILSNYKLPFSCTLLPHATKGSRIRIL